MDTGKIQSDELQKDYANQLHQHRMVAGSRNIEFKTKQVREEKPSHQHRQIEDKLNPFGQKTLPKEVRRGRGIGGSCLWFQS